MERIACFAALVLLGTPAFAAEEYAIGKAKTVQHLTLVPHYLTGIAMSPMPEGASMDKDAVHLEIDVHAASGEPHGFAKGEWIPYLTVNYYITKEGSDFHANGTLAPMTAGDGPHYANNVALSGPGSYTVTYHIEPPPKAGFARHTDKATGVPDWWNGFDAAWTFAYPVKK
ncbi:MAG: iron transporter [Alphaproteobacteria bacterium]